MIMELFGKQKSQAAFPFEKNSHILHVKPMRESVLVRTVIFRWNENEHPHQDSEPAKQLFQHPDHVFQWKVLVSVPMNNRKRKT